jgi:hypothetical protein
VEISWLGRLFPTVKGKLLELSHDPAAKVIVEKVFRYKHLTALESGAKKARESLRAELLAVARDNDEVALPGGVRFKVATRSIAEQTRKGSVSKTLMVTVPEPAGAARGLALWS